MATLTIRNLPDDVRDRLRIRAAEKGRSMEAEAREIVTSAVTGAEGAQRDIADRVRLIQERIAQYIPPGSYTVDQFLAEKRADERAEEEKWARIDREGREPPKRKPRKASRG